MLFVIMFEFLPFLLKLTKKRLQRCSYSARIYDLFKLLSSECQQFIKYLDKKSADEAIDKLGETISYGEKLSPD